MRKIKCPKSFSIEIGLWNNRHYPSGVSVAEVAKYNAEGTDRIPSRNFFTFHRDELRAVAREGAIAMVRQSNRGGDISPEITETGIRGAAVLRDAVTVLDFPPNAPATIARKGSDNPLIDTGLLRQSIEWRMKE
jgi:hypothetical protein